MAEPLDLAPPDDPTWLGLPNSKWPTDTDDNPFVRYRTLLDSYRRARDRGWSDRRFVQLVRSLDEAVAAVEGHGFIITPLTHAGALAASVGHQAALWIKDETHNVGGSHKARHLFGLALHLAVEEVPLERPLAISSCGNAALAASIIARATERSLLVFVPSWADEGIIDQLQRNHARIEVCRRLPGELGDPCHRLFLDAVAGGAVAFGCQGPDEPRTLDGGRTLGWELAQQIEGCDRLIVHVGGGALGSSLTQGLVGAVRLGRWSRVPRIDTVQTEGCAPLAAAVERLRLSLDRGASWNTIDPTPFMQPWPDEPHSAADGILDDVTYDWLVLAWAMLTTGGRTIVVPESDVLAAHQVATDTGWNASVTGTAGLAGLLTSPEPDLDTTLIISGIS